MFFWGFCGEMGVAGKTWNFSVIIIKINKHNQKMHFSAMYNNSLNAIHTMFKNNENSTNILKLPRHSLIII